jgi:hypothetical protein
MRPGSDAEIAGYVRHSQGHVARPNLPKCRRYPKDQFLLVLGGQYRSDVRAKINILSHHCRIAMRRKGWGARRD